MLQGKLNAIEKIRNQLKARKKELVERLEDFGLLKQFKQFKKQVYYYQQQLTEYKAQFEDPSKLEKKLTELVLQLPLFKSFFANHSQLGNLFALPGGNPSAAVLAGLQSRESVLQSITDRFGQGVGVQQLLQQNMNEAQGLINDLKNKMYSLGAGSSDEEIPDFKPNNQKSKSFFQRLELGTNVQTQKAYNYFPVTSDIGLSLGYKLNDRSVIGIGTSYKVGWGKSWNDINITHQGVGLRTFIDWKIKGSFWISGGYEQNYNTGFSNLSQLQNISNWKQSGLIGLSKVISLKSKLFKKTSVKLLWDFLSYRQVPRTQVLMFRVGYILK